MTRNGFGEIDERFDPASSRPEQPVGEERLSLFALELEGEPQLLLEQVRTIEGLVRSCDERQLPSLPRGEILRVLPQGEARALQLASQDGFPVPASLVPHIASDLVESLGG